MKRNLRIAFIGLDTSHTGEFIRRMQAPDCQDDQKITGLTAVSCLRFPTAFHSEEGQDERQRQIEKWGVKVTFDFDEAVAGCDAVMITINEPALHLKYVELCSGLGKPVFLDKPLADTYENGRRICNIARAAGMKLFSASSLRFVSELEQVLGKIVPPLYSSIFGPVGKAPSGSSIVWYGVHAFEMLEKLMGRGALNVRTHRDDPGMVCVVEYPNGRRGTVELTEGAYVYGGTARDKVSAEAFVVDMRFAYTRQLECIADFFRGAEDPVTLEDALEVMGLLEAAESSYNSGRKTPLPGTV